MVQIPIKLRGGNETQDIRLDRLPEFDERSRQFPIRTLVEAKKPRSYTWRCKDWLDQGREGACVGFAFGHELISRPREFPATNAFARGIYLAAQKEDEWAGEAYEGTSVLAGAKVVVTLGHFTEYRWAFGIDDLKIALGYAGPAVLGLNWYRGMFQPDAKGFIHPTGGVMGGHAILARGINLKEGYVLLRNSWGQDWGLNGDCKISIDDLSRLLKEDGEACIPIARKKV